MKTEFDLSEERKKLFNPVFIPLNGYDKNTLEEVRKIVEMQDKEFIRLLKEEIHEAIFNNKWEAINTILLNKIIDKLSGASLAGVRTQTEELRG